MEICVWDLCNNKCRMCTNPDRPWPAWDGSASYDIKSLKKRIIKREEEFKKGDSLYLSGGEPTIHPQFFDILSFLTKKFPQQTIKLLTNGRRFSYNNFAREVMSINSNLEIDMSLYGHNSETHDKVTRTKNSFSQTLAGLHNILKNKNEKQQVGVRLVLTKISYKYINEILKLLSEDFSEADRIIIIFMEYEAQVLKNLKDVKITYKQVAPYIDKTDKYLGSFKNLRYYHFPLCVINKKFWPNNWNTWPKNETSFSESCSECKLKRYCVGIHNGYIKNIGAKEFIPIKKNYQIIKRKTIYNPIKKII